MSLMVLSPPHNNINRRDDTTTVTRPPSSRIFHRCRRRDAPERRSWCCAGSRWLFVVMLLLLIVAGSVSADDSSPVTCGSSIKLQHRDTGYYLNSEEKNLGSGSGQQIVTFVRQEGDPNTLWHVRPAQHEGDHEYDAASTTCQFAEPIRCNTVVRFTHQSTYKNLHSHGVSSPLSHQQEVSAYGQGDGKGDNGDNWKVICGATHWNRNAIVQLQHVDTGKFLGTSKQVEYNQQTCGVNCPIAGHLEAFGRSAADANCNLKVHQGIHLSV